MRCAVIRAGCSFVSSQAESDGCVYILNLILQPLANYNGLHTDSTQPEHQNPQLHGTQSLFILAPAGRWSMPLLRTSSWRWTRIRPFEAFRWSARFRVEGFRVWVFFALV